MVDQRIIPDFTEPHEGYTNVCLRKMVRELRGQNRRFREALDCLVQQTVDQDLKYGIELSEGEADAREKALAVLAEGVA